MGAMGPMHMEHMPSEAMAAMPMPAEAYSGPGAWMDMDGDGMPPPAMAGMAPMGGDPMGDPMGGAPMGGDPTGGASMGSNPAFDGAMAAMDGAQAANMAEGMDAANTAADADEGKVDTAPGGSDVV